jgi:hypothetical protein
MLRKVNLPENLPPRVKFKLLFGGVGGMENPLGVKCLHLHLASFLGGVPDPIGEEVLKKHLRGVQNCKNGYCKRFLEEKKT